MTYDNTILDDEYHPTARLAAFYADGEALLFARKVYAGAIKRREAVKDRSAKEQNTLDDLRTLLANVEQRIKDRDPNDEPED